MPSIASWQDIATTLKLARQRHKKRQVHFVTGGMARGRAAPKYFVDSIGFLPEQTVYSYFHGFPYLKGSSSFV